MVCPIDKLEYSKKQKIDKQDFYYDSGQRGIEKLNLSKPNNKQTPLSVQYVNSTILNNDTDHKRQILSNTYIRTIDLLHDLLHVHVHFFISLGWTGSTG